MVDMETQRDARRTAVRFVHFGGGRSRRMPVRAGGRGGIDVCVQPRRRRCPRRSASFFLSLVSWLLLGLTRDDRVPGSTSRPSLLAGTQPADSLRDRPRRPPFHSTATGRDSFCQTPIPLCSVSLSSHRPRPFDDDDDDHSSITEERNTLRAPRPPCQIPSAQRPASRSGPSSSRFSSSITLLANTVAGRAGRTRGGRGT